MLIKAITKSKDGYKIYFEEGKLLIIECLDGQYVGWSRWADYWGINSGTIEEGSILGEKIINYPDIDPMVKSHIEYIIDQTK